MIAMQTRVKAVLGEKVFDQLLPAATGAAPPQTPVKFRIIGKKGEAMGKILPPGQGEKDKKTASMDPVMCRHPDAEMMARGNAKDKWWTCKKCLSRFERLTVSEMTPADSQPQDQDLVVFGKYTGSTYLEVYQQDPQYCNWLMQTAEAGESSEQMLRLANYIQTMRLVETYEAEDIDLDM
jgi:hypothetical protein